MEKAVYLERGSVVGTGQCTWNGAVYLEQGSVVGVRLCPWDEAVYLEKWGDLVIVTLSLHQHHEKGPNLPRAK